MVSDVIDIENIQLQLESELEKYRQENQITYADLAWMLLQMGTNYYFKDICYRGLNKNNHHVSGRS